MRAVVTLTEGERARRRLLWEEAPGWLKARFRADVALRVGALGEARAKEEAWVVFMRLRAWERRGADAKACDRCGALVLWRRESGRMVPTSPDGARHACGEGRA